MKDYYSNTRKCFDEYNEILDQIKTSPEEITDDQEEKLDNHCLYLAHSLLMDIGPGEQSREMLNKVADIIKDVVI